MATDPNSTDQAGTVEKLVTVETQAEFDLATSTWEHRVFVKLYVAARTSGLLREISDRDWKTLCVLATFMDEQGNCYPSQDEIADALGVTRQTANERIQSLKKFRFKGKPVIHIQKARVQTEQGGRWANNRYTILPVSNLKIFDSNKGNGNEPMSGNADTGGPMSGDPDTGNPDTNKKYVVVDNDVVEILIDQGIHYGAAEQLAMGYPRDYIEEKIQILEGLRRSPDNPAGWLRKAIEENYVPPAKPKSRKRKTPRRNSSGGSQLASKRSSEPEQEEYENWELRKPQEPPEPPFDGDPEALVAWKRAYDELELQLPRDTFNTWLWGSHMLSYKDGKYTLGVKNIYAREWLEQRLKKAILRTLSRIVGEEVGICFVTLKAAADTSNQAKDG